MFYPRANNGANIIYVAIKPLMEKLREKLDELQASAKKSAWLNNIVNIQIIF